MEGTVVFHFFRGLGLALGLALIFVASAAFAGEHDPRLTIETPLSTADTALIASQWHEALALLPTTIRAQLPRRIRLKVAQLSSHPLTPETICPMMSRPTGIRVAQSSYRRLKTPEIVLDQGWLAIYEQLAKGQDAPLRCSHGRMSLFAQATWIHELAHLYDRGSRLRLDDLVIPPACLRGGKSHPITCKQYLDQPKRAVSDSVEFRRLTTFDLSLKEPRNQHTKASPDPYEFTSSEEAFAVNLEYYLLDPQFSYRRPALADFFDRQFTSHAFVPSPSQTHLRLFTRDLEPQQTPRLFEAAKNRIYRVDYLWAAKGQAMMSRWGHAMLRLVVCAPRRTTVGPECLNDTSHHIVIGFRGVVGGLTVDYIDGVKGDYPSLLIASTWGSTRREYGLSELRDLTAFPLLLSPSEKNRLIDLIHETYWSYRGKYRFLSQNCASELLFLLQTASENRLFKSLRPDLVTPISLIRALSDANLIVPLTRDERVRLTAGIRLEDPPHGILIYPSRQRLLEKADQQLRQKYGFRFLKSSTAERQSRFRQLLAQPEFQKEDRIRIIELVTMIQSYTIEALKISLKNEIVKALATPSTNDPSELASIEKAAKQLTDFSSEIRQTLAYRPYGVPFPEEIPRVPEPSPGGPVKPPQLPTGSSIPVELKAYLDRHTAKTRARLKKAVEFFNEINDAAKANGLNTLN